MNEFITINDTDIKIKEYNGERVVTLKDIDMVHSRPEGTARRNFNTNKEHLFENEDYFVRNSYEAKIEFDIIAPNGLILITESGYLMLVKSFTDNLAWQVQRKLVNTYFRVKHAQKTPELTPIEMIAQIANNAVEMQRRQKEIEARQEKQAIALKETNRKIDGIGKVISLNKTSWRKDVNKIIRKISSAFYTEYATIGECYAEIYAILEHRAGCNLSIRLNYKQQRMREAGVSLNRINSVSKIDVIADDNKLTEIFIAIVKEMAVKHGICADIADVDADTYEYDSSESCETIFDNVHVDNSRAANTVRVITVQESDHDTDQEISRIPKKRKAGRPPMPFPDNWEKYYNAWCNKEISAMAAAKAINVAYATFFRLVKRYKEM